MKTLTILALGAFLSFGSAPVRAEMFETSAGSVEVARKIEGLDTPWALGFLPDDSVLVTERGGRLLLVREGQARAVAGVPRVWAEGQGGLLDVVVARDFATSGEIFLTYSEPAGRGAATALARARLEPDAPRLTGLRVLFRQGDPTKSGRHFGSRVVEAPDGTLYLTLGERGERDSAQDPSSFRGKVVRLDRNGSIPSGNPFAGGTGGGAPEVWSYGHRNPQGAALGLDGALLVVEHGARGGDEINRPAAGRNYGWPEISYGREYSGGRIGQGTSAAGMEQPLFYWDPSIAPSGMAVYSGRLWPEWRGDVFVGSLKFDFLSRLEGGPEGYAERERLFEGAFPRIRDVREAPDGSIWFLSETDGAAFRMAPAPD